jgi:hypothetical protein
MDALKLNLRAKDQLHPFLTELMSGYSRFKGSNEWEGRSKILHWLITLNALKASDEITEEQSRQVCLWFPTSITPTRQIVHFKRGVLPATYCTETQHAHRPRNTLTADALRH